MTILNLGFIGLGIMGAPMACQLRAASHTLYVNTRSKLSDVLRDAAGAISCADAAEVARKADIVFTMLPDTPDVEKVLFGTGGIASGLSAGKIVVDMSSIDPIATKEFAKQINALGCDYLDAPVSGGEVGAKAATLTIMVGGPQTTFDRVRPLRGAHECLRRFWTTGRPTIRRWCAPLRPWQTTKWHPASKCRMPNTTQLASTSNAAVSAA